MTDSSSHVAKHVKDEVNKGDIEPEKIEEQWGQEIADLESLSWRIFDWWSLLFQEFFCFNNLELAFGDSLRLLARLLWKKWFPDSKFEILLGFQLVGFEHERYDEEEQKDQTQQTNVPEQGQSEYLVVRGSLSELILIWEMDKCHCAVLIELNIQKSNQSHLQYKIC